FMILVHTSPSTPRISRILMTFSWLGRTFAFMSSLIVRRFLPGPALRVGDRRLWTAIIDGVEYYRWHPGRLDPIARVDDGMAAEVVAAYLANLQEPRLVDSLSDLDPDRVYVLRTLKGQWTAVEIPTW